MSYNGRPASNNSVIVYSDGKWVELSAGALQDSYTLIETHFLGLVSSGSMWGDPGWSSAGSITASALASEVKHPGIYRGQMNGTNGISGYAAMNSTTSTSTMFNINGVDFYEFVLRLSTSVASVFLNIGMMQSVNSSVSGTDGVFFFSMIQHLLLIGDVLLDLRVLQLLQRLLLLSQQVIGMFYQQNVQVLDGIFILMNHR